MLQNIGTPDHSEELTAVTALLKYYNIYNHVQNLDLLANASVQAPQ